MIVAAATAQSGQQRSRWPDRTRLQEVERKRKQEEEERKRKQEEQERKRKQEEEGRRKEEQDRIRRMQQQRNELISKANSHLEEGAFIESLSFVNDLLASFPNDKDALEMRRTIVASFHDEVSEL